MTHSPGGIGDEPRCKHTRLAESSVAVIDTCTCGVIALHFGALTLRFAPCAASELLATLGDALEKHAAHAAGSPDVPLTLRGSVERGRA